MVAAAAVLCFTLVDTQTSEDVVGMKNHALQQIRTISRLLECKVCKDLPDQPIIVLCCGQILGCQSCFERCNRACPLCRAEDPGCVNITGNEELYALLRRFSADSHGSQ